jgi:hypothetical protein
LQHIAVETIDSAATKSLASQAYILIQSGFGCIALRRILWTTLFC